jgi:DNA-3-methyladenine glycosylase
MPLVATDPLFRHDAPQLARRLIGALLTHDGVGGIIVETEAYDSNDPASHSFGGEHVRNRVMFGPPGHFYVYRSYGLHWCLNIVCGTGGAAVLIRALQPTAGLGVMEERRGTSGIRNLCRGPGRLCQALGVTGALNGTPVGAPIALDLAAAAPPIQVSPRIGISRGIDTPWRFFDPTSAYVSGPRPSVATPAASD